MNRATLDAASTYWPAVKSTAIALGLPPATLLAIMWRESCFGIALKPQGPGGTGDQGHGRGLMQVDDRAHRAWVQANDWANPAINIRKGAEVLRDALTKLEAAGYHDAQLLSMALAAYNAGVGAVLRAVKAGQPADSVTTGRDYAKWVLERAAELKLMGFE